MDVQTKGSSALMDLVREKPLVLVAWLFAFALVYQFASNDIRYVLEHGAWQASPGTLVGRDFVNMFSAGHMMFDRGLTGIYNVNAYQAYQSALFDDRVAGHNYSYTPVSFFYVWLFALPPYPVAFLLWTGLTGAAFAFAARPYLRGAGLPTWIAVLTPAALLNVWAGHYGFLFGALWLGAWSLLDSRPRLAGVLVGLMIVKPHLAILMPLMLAARGAWRTFFAAAVTVIALIVSSGLLFGWQLWADYVSHTILFQAVMVDQTEQFFLRMMPTAYPAFRLAGLEPAAAWIAQGMCVLCALNALLRGMPRDPRLAGLATATATFLVLPYAFNYDMTIVGVAAVILLHRASKDESVTRIAAALALLLPAIVVFTSELAVPIGPILLILLLGRLVTSEAPGPKAVQERQAA